MKRICAVVAALLAALGLDAQVMCWNLENYFDPYDDPLTADEAFTPAGEHHWTFRKFKAKRNLIAKTIIASAECFEGRLPAIVGLCEVENAFVLKSLLEDTPLAKVRYKALHRESPDPRGIDVALLYDPDRVRLLDCEFITIREFATREILYAKLIVYYGAHSPETESQGLRGDSSGVYLNIVDATCAAESPRELHSTAPTVYQGQIAVTCENRLTGQACDTLHVFVNHWPSKYSGARASAPKRLAVARALESKLDSIYAAEPLAQILVMGDFNDTPDSPSVRGLCERCQLHNLSAAGQGGTIRFKGKWETIDHILASPAAAKRFTSEIYKPDFLLEDDKSFMGKKPRRTNVGPRYNGGASDHLPLIADIF